MIDYKVETYKTKRVNLSREDIENVLFQHFLDGYKLQDTNWYYDNIPDGLELVGVRMENAD